MTKFNQVSLQTHKQLVQRLATQSWTELNHSNPLDIDWDMLEKLEELGALKVYTYGEVGVGVVILSPSIHHRSKLTAVIDMVYIEKEHRGVGNMFLSYIENMLKGEGVQLVTIGLPPKYGDNPSLLKNKPYKKTDNLFMRSL